MNREEELEKEVEKLIAERDEARQMENVIIRGLLQICLENNLRPDSYEIIEASNRANIKKFSINKTLC